MAKNPNKQHKDLRYTARGIPEKGVDGILTDSPTTIKQFTEKNNKIITDRKEASRLVSLANKRIKRLEKNGLTDSPAYKGYIAHGGKPFSVRGKNHNQLQAEMARLRHFIEAETSTVRGCNRYLKQMAKNTGLKYKNLTDLRAKAPKFFELASKVEQHLRQVEDMASAINYHEIWQSINQYTKAHRVNLADTERDIYKMVEQITDTIKEYEEPEVDIWGITFRLEK